MAKEQRFNNKNTNAANTNSPHSIWTDILLSKFGFKCLMNKHDLCADVKCKCLCHPHNQQWWNVARRVTIMINDNLDKKIRLLQAKRIQKENKPVSYSLIVNSLLKNLLK